MKTVLLTDDDPDITELIKLKLTDPNYLLITARDGQEAINICLEDSPDMILMDINMPTINGFDATKLLRSKGFDNPIIILTSSDSEQDRNTADEIGCNGYILKTQDLADVKQTVDWVINKYLYV